MKNLLYYDLENSFVQDEISAGGDGTHVSTIVDGVAWCKDTKNAFYNNAADRKREKYKTMYLTFEILSNGYISWRAKSGSLTRTIQYSKDGGNSWTTITSTTGGTNINVVAGDTVMFRGNNYYYATDSDNSYNGFSGSTAQFKAKGNIMSLINSTNFVSLTTLTGTYAFSSMFRDCTTLTDISDLLLPALTLTNCCYRGMFMKCTSLSGDIPELPAKTVPYWGYQAMYRESSVSKVSSNLLSCTKIGTSSLRDMFYGCTQLTSAPIELNLTTMSGQCCMGMFNGCTNLVTGPKELNSTSLASECYAGMFSGCTSLTTAPELPATTLAESCYTSMFQGCTSLTQAPELPATTLANSCYRGMFSGCTNLTTAPELPATTLADYCYSCMFSTCTNLTTAPNLPATILKPYCYKDMFVFCGGLTKCPELQATTLANYCYDHLFHGCSALTAAPELPATILAQYCYCDMFSKCTNITEAPELPATTLVTGCYYYMFDGCSKLNYIKCLATNISAYNCTGYWVRNVASSGTFVKNQNMSSWTTGSNGIPANWTVQDAS